MRHKHREQRKLDIALAVEIVVFCVLFYFFDSAVKTGGFITWVLSNMWDSFLVALQGGIKW